jgi:biofilm PGA synthesis N-glycosyltransferase PgaC
MKYIEYLNIAICVYSILISMSYILLGILSARALNFYIRKNRFVSYDALLTSPNAPTVSLIAPAYNEQKSIVENIRSLLSLHYNNFEVIIVNDGSKDETLQIMIDAYGLEKVNFAVHQVIPGKPIRGVYKSSNPAYKKLLVVDKVNGGKADALNAGINISNFDYITCIDVDCIIEQDGILKMVKPFMEENKYVIATGGVVRIANSCEIEDGKLIKAHVPRNIIPRFQVIEYLRAFLMGRMAWSKLNGLLLISERWACLTSA